MRPAPVGASVHGTGRIDDVLGDGAAVADASTIDVEEGFVIASPLCGILPGRDQFLADEQGVARSVEDGEEVPLQVRLRPTPSASGVPTVGPIEPRIQCVI